MCQNTKHVSLTFCLLKSEAILMISISLVHFDRYAREFSDPYHLSHGIGPVPGYGVRGWISPYFSIAAFAKNSFVFVFPNYFQTAMYRGGYNRFTPY